MKDPRADEFMRALRADAERERAERERAEDAYELQRFQAGLAARAQQHQELVARRLDDIREATSPNKHAHEWSYNRVRDGMVCVCGEFVSGADIKRCGDNRHCARGQISQASKMADEMGALETRNMVLEIDVARYRESYERAREFMGPTMCKRFDKVR
jgi:hypothetical protein